MSKTNLVWSVVGIQAALFLAVLFIYPSVHFASPMKTENWIFGVMVGFLILGFIYIAAITVFAASKQKN